MDFCESTALPQQATDLSKVMFNSELTVGVNMRVNFSDGQKLCPGYATVGPGPTRPWIIHIKVMDGQICAFHLCWLSVPDIYAIIYSA